MKGKMRIIIFLLFYNRICKILPQSKVIPNIYQMVFTFTIQYEIIEKQFIYLKKMDN